MDDKDIVALFNARSESAIHETSEKYDAYCRAIASRFLSDEEDISECMNDVYLGAWNSIPPHQPQCLRTYVGRITRNVACHRLERASALKRGGGEWERLLCELEECLPSDSDTEIEADARFLKEVLERFLDSLPADERWVMVRRCWYAASFAEIAAELHLREGTVKVMLHRIRKKLKVVLEKEGVRL